jgi:hypothetical protein
VAEYPPLLPTVKERYPLRGVLRTSLTDGSAAGISSHEKNVFFSFGDEPMKEAKAGNDSAVKSSTFFGECRTPTHFQPIEKIPVYSLQCLRVTAIFHKLLKISRFPHLQNQHSWVQLPSGAPRFQ